MSPGLVLLLLLAADSTATPPDTSTGLKFTVVFPENIAFYHPVQPKNQIQITALYDNTEVTITSSTFSTQNPKLSKGTSQGFNIDVRMEMWKEETSEKALQISSTKQIAVHAITLKNYSVQTALVIPGDKLGTEYVIPPAPKIQGTNDPVSAITTAVTEREPFKLIIVNGDSSNQVTIEGTGENKDVLLEPNHIAQIWLKEEEAFRKVRANQPVSVLFGHPCAVQYNCTCGLLYATLPPAKQDKQKFYVPPVLAAHAAEESFLLLSDGQSRVVKAFDPDSPSVKTAGVAIFYRPGLLLTLIPETDFGSCYVVSSIPDTLSSVLIVVHKDVAAGVRLGSLSLNDSVWEDLRGTEFTSALVHLASGKTVIWHTSSKMAVYFMGTKGHSSFGNPAPIISKTPDFRGCVLSPEVIKIGEVADGWRESLEYCRDQDLELVSFPEAKLQRQISQQVLQAKNDSLQEVWIGMRRSSLSGQWYWLSGAPVNDTNWEDGEPGSVHDGQCAIMSLQEDKDFGWRDEDCCKTAHPVCYRKPVLFPV